MFTCLFKDNQGNMWFAGHKGLIKYDMNQFTFISTGDGLIDNYVTGIHEDGQHNLWFKTRWLFCQFSNNT